MKIAFIGAGQVGAPLAARLALAGHEVVLAQSEEGAKSVAAALARTSRLSALAAPEAIAFADIVFLATPFAANESALRPLSHALAGKTLVDCTNPVGPGFSHGLRNERSGAEFVQALVPKTSVVKAFSIYGFENLEDPTYPGHTVKPVMLYCGDDVAAKTNVGQLISDVGFEPFDVGGLVQSLHLEHMTLLWVRLVRGGGQSPNLVWAALRR
jgi:hypothetical protein